MQARLWSDPARDDERRALIGLSLVAGVGPGRMRLLMRRFGSPLKILAASTKQLASVEGVGGHTAAAIRSFDAWAEVDRQTEVAARLGARLLHEEDPSYPPLLRQIYDPPVFLWTLGEADLSMPSVALVGTRRATEYGKRIAMTFAEELASAGIAVVSGMAYGIDAIAHERTVAVGGTTVGVLGSGIDVIYPARHAELATRIVSGAGALISEFPLGAKPDAPNFPRRNRIVSGLCLAVIVIEAHEQGGALITARLALEQNREVYAVPSALHSRAGAGTNALIRDGHAKLVTSVSEVIEDLTLEGGQPAASRFVPPDLPPEERRLYEALKDDPMHIDRLCSTCDLDSSSALVYLLNLEFKGLVRQMAGKQFLRA